MDFEDLNNTTKLRLRNNGINNNDELVNHLLDRIVELEEMIGKDKENSHWRISKDKHPRIGVKGDV